MTAPKPDHDLQPGTRVRWEVEGTLTKGGYLVPDGANGFVASPHVLARYGTLTVLSTPEPSWAQTRGAVCRFDNGTWGAVWLCGGSDKRWYQCGDRYSCTYAEMCALYPSDPVLLYPVKEEK